MKTILLNLKLNRKLAIIGLIGISGLVVSILIVLYILSSLDKERSKLESYALVSMNSEIARTNYNAIRSDILQLFILDPVIRKDAVKKTNEHYVEIMTSLKEKREAIVKDTQDDPDLKQLGQTFSETIDEFILFSDDNKMRIMAIRGGQDSLYAEMEKKLIDEYEPLFRKLLADRNAFISVVQRKIEITTREIELASDKGFWLIIIFAVLTSVAVFLISTYISGLISRAILKVRDRLDEISQGELPEVDDTHLKDEIGEINNSLKVLINNLKNVRIFTQEVGKSNFRNEISIFDNKGDIAQALFSMTENLKQSAETETKQNWIGKGLTEAGKILRINYEKSTTDLCNAIISFVVKYLSANQGSFFVVSEEDKNIQLAAVWAYDRKKYINKTVGFGEGLVGQVYMEREAVYLTNIPDNYIHITSGLGEATPKNLIIFPLINNDSVQGILEIASFRIIESHQVEFLKQLADLVASDIAAQKINVRTQQLLEQSQHQTEELKAQEEEVRQNLEELSATQETMQRVVKESEEKEKYLSDLINLSNDSISTVSRDYKLHTFNKSFNTIILKLFGFAAFKGFDTLELNPTELLKQKQRDTFDRVFKGEKFDQTDQFDLNGEISFVMSTYAPLYDINKNVVAVAIFSRDITEMMRIGNGKKADR